MFYPSAPSNPCPLAADTPGLLTGHSIEMLAREVAGLKPARRYLAPGSAVSITYLSTDTQQARVDAAAAVRREGFEPVPHIAARRLGSAAQLADFLAALVAEAGVQQVFIIAGDADTSLGGYEDSLAVIRSGLLERYGIVQVGLAGHPGGHAQIADARLWNALSDKTAALDERGLSCEIVTQFAFEAGPVLSWLERLRASGIHAPVRVGLPGPASVGALLRFASRCGVRTSARTMARYGAPITRLLDTAGPDRLVQVLCSGLDPARHGHVGAHLYPFGGLLRTARWAHAYSCAPALPSREGDPG